MEGEKEKGSSVSSVDEAVKYCFEKEMLIPVDLFLRSKRQMTWPY